MPEPLHTEWCSKESGVDRGFRLGYSTLALFFVTSGLAMYGMATDPWIGEGGGSPLLLFSSPFVAGAMIAGGGLAGLVLGAAFQFGACLLVVWLFKGLWHTLFRAE